MVHTSIILPLSVAQFTPDIQARYAQAIAAAAGVPVANVHIIAVHAITLGGGRRLLEFGAPAIDIHTSVYESPTMEIQDLNAHLQSQGLPSPRRVVVEIHKEVVSSFRLP